MAYDFDKWRLAHHVRAEEHIFGYRYYQTDMAILPSLAQLTIPPLPELQVRQPTQWWNILPSTSDSVVSNVASYLKSACRSPSLFPSSSFVSSIHAVHRSFQSKSFAFFFAVSYYFQKPQHT